ncbi:S-layer homology domain-containing protein [Citricoccus sp. SGAir0253]|uniref:S-layer homology domain-containing protein n=1 Tax=Citricoccus sp. SGAir0253 TaxID=2567881 RepID=UPI00143D23C2|nr:S-layer homology domain-containing protein [Citricoccus sp. SGAir0253]
MSRQHPALRRRRPRILATALALGLLAPAAAVAAPAHADTDELTPLDQSTEFDPGLPVLDERVLDALAGAGKDPGTGGTDAAEGGTDATGEHLGPCLQDFLDVAPGSTFYTHVTWMACAGLAAGYRDHTFGVKRDITRGEAALLLYRLSGETHRPGTDRDFEDVDPQGGDEAFTAISWLHEEKIVHGYADGTFRPTRPISRGELAAYLFRFAGEAGYVAPAKPIFSDVPASASGYRDISWLAERRIVSGYADGTYRPARNITRGETAKLLYGVESLLRGTPAPPATRPKPAPAPEPAPAPAVPLAYRYVVISDDGLNVRTGPGVGHRRIAALPRNTKVVITGRSQSVSGVTWREITVGAVRGWVHGGYLMRDFEAGAAKSSLARRGTVSAPDTPRRGVVIVDTDWAAQPNGYWCGPASIKIVMSGYGVDVTQGAMADQAQTDREGTWLHQVARVLDYNAPTAVRYTVKTIPGADATYAQRIAFRDDVRRSIRSGVPAVVNIAATPDEQAPLHRAKTGGRFTLRHHMPIVGYNANDNTVLVDDPWTRPFWVDTYRLADMAGTRGYTVLR